MSDIASLYLPCRAGIGHLSSWASEARREAMSTYEDPIAMPDGFPQLARAKAVVL
jgi:hypothetical protein